MTTTGGRGLAKHVRNVEISEQLHEAVGLVLGLLHELRLNARGTVLHIEVEAGQLVAVFIVGEMNGPRSTGHLGGQRVPLLVAVGAVAKGARGHRLHVRARADRLGQSPR
ncbi:hypothetical protein [Plantibacter flavus]|uniref:hypothetical protein n=1 Tax=Plantibacter flavus TaxID=150123 RepID=UPI00117C4FE6|nr:hypothetical protein [Plantibacter flavus]